MSESAIDPFTPVEDDPVLAAPVDKPKRAKKQQVSIGRIVHYVAQRNVAARLNTDVDTHCAAIVTAVEAETSTVSLFVFSPALNQPHNVAFVTEGDTSGTWHWPEQA